MENNYKKTKSYLYWLFGGIFGFHEAYLRRLNRLRFRYTIINLALFFSITQLIIGLLLNQIYISFDNISYVLKITLSFLFMYWVLDGLLLLNLVNKANKDVEFNDGPFKINDNEVLLQIISKNIFGAYHILLGKSKFMYFILPTAVQCLIGLFICILIPPIALYLSIYLSGGNDYSAIGALMLVLGIFASPILLVSLCIIALSSFISIFLFIKDLKKYKKLLNNKNINCYSDSHLNNLEKKSLLLSLILSLILSMLFISNYNFNIILISTKLHSNTSNENRNVFDKRDINKLKENPSNYENYYFKDISFHLFEAKTNKSEGIIYDLYDNNVTLKGDKDLLKYIYDENEKDSHNDTFLISGVMDCNGDDLIFYIDSCTLLDEDDDRIFTPIYRTINIDKKVSLKDFDISVSKMKLSMEHSLLGISIKNTTNKNILIDSYDIDYKIRKDDSTSNRVDADVFVQQSPNSSVSNILKAKTSYSGEINFPYGINDNECDKIILDLYYTYNKNWDGYDDNTRPKMDNKISIEIDLKSENIKIDNKVGVKADTVNSTDEKVILQDKELSNNIKLLSFMTERVLLSPFEDPTKVSSMDKKDIVIQKDKIKKAFDDFDNDLNKIDDYRVKDYANKLRVLLTHYITLIEAKVNDDEKTIQLTKKAIESYEAKIESERFEMFKLSYNPSEYIDYVLPEMLGISFEHVDDLRNIEFKHNSYYDVFLNMLNYPNYQETSPYNGMNFDDYIMEKRSLEELYYTSDAGKMSPGKCINDKYVEEFKSFVEADNKIRLR